MEMGSVFHFLLSRTHAFFTFGFAVTAIQRFNGHFSTFFIHCHLYNFVSRVYPQFFARLAHEPCLTTSHF